MIHVENGQIKLKGSGDDLLRDALAIVYSLRRNMIESDNMPFVYNLDINLLAIMEGKFDENVMAFAKFDNEDDAKRFRAEYDSKMKNSTAENIMRDILKD